MSDLEIEVKFFLSDPEDMRNRLARAGAAGSGRVFEQNLRFDDARESLRKGESLLRLRQDREARLTFKGDPGAAGAELAKTAKVFRELEVTVSDFGRTRAILESLGFFPAQTYEKWRTTFHLGAAECCLDEMPFGAFLEIEGEPETIMSASRLLGLSWNRRILTNYLALFEAVRKAHVLNFTDLTFANFESLEMDAEPVIRKFEAGPESGNGGC
jgi:adenylate cyclase class 2